METKERNVPGVRRTVGRRRAARREKSAAACVPVSVPNPGSRRVPAERSHRPATGNRSSRAHRLARPRDALSAYSATMKSPRAGNESGAPIEGSMCALLNLGIAERIRRRWQRAGLGRWSAAACDWAARFDGIEHLAGEPGLAPTCAVWRLALHYCRFPCAANDVRVAVALARLPFAHWRARWPAWASVDGQSRRWNPLQQPLREFIALGTAPDELIVWEGARPTVPLRDVVAFLLSRLTL